MHHIKYICLFVLLASYACQEVVIEQSTTDAYDYSYFPLDSGFYKEYQMESIVIDVPSEIYDTSNFYLKEIFTGYHIDAGGDSVMRIERLYRDSLYKEWEPYGVWTAKLVGNKAIQTEENLKLVKMVFPLDNGLSWEGNSMNRNDTLLQYPYEVTVIDSVELIGELAFDSVLTIKHRFKESLVDKIDDYEKYAYGVGLVYKQQVDLYTDIIDPEIPIEDRLKTGSSLFMQIIDYGYE